MSRQRIDGFLAIEGAVLRLLRRVHHEVVDPETFRPEVADVLLEQRYVMIAGAAQIGEGDMRLVFAALGREAGAACGALALCGEAGEIRRRLDAGPERCGFASAETAGAGETDFKWRLDDLSKLPVKIARGRLIDFAKESQGQMILLGRAPEGPGNLAFERRQPVGDGFRQRNGGEEAEGHVGRD